MTTLDRQQDVEAGSRMHLLDWLDSSNFLPDLRRFVEPTGLTIADDAERRPKGRHDHRESVLVGRKAPFLSTDQQDTLTGWWLVNRKGAKLPTWDLVVSARDALDRDALVLVEAKAHATELSGAGKPQPRRDTHEQQRRSDENHSQIACAIAEANAALQHAVPGIALDRDRSYQFANRIAFASKLASLGVPVALIYLGFIGDHAIAGDDHCLRQPGDWQAAFDQHTAGHFPVGLQGRKIDCGRAGFWLLVRDLLVLRQSPPIEQRRVLP